MSRHNKILTVFSFLKIEGEDIAWYQFYYPLILTCVGFSLFISGRWVGLEIDESDFVSDLNSLMGVLVGFYIASLAAVSSFENKNLDIAMKGRPTKLRTFRADKEIVETLTRRRFLTILFGYCAILSVIVFALGMLSLNVSFEVELESSFFELLRFLTYVFWAGYSWLLSSLLVSTLLGLHYLVDRMHRS
jgi:hypothetical protein